MDVDGAEAEVENDEGNNNNNNNENGEELEYDEEEQQEETNKEEEGGYYEEYDYKDENGKESGEDFNEYFESESFYEDLNNANESARKTLAMNLIHDWRQCAIERGDRDFLHYYDSMKNNLEGFIEANKNRLDFILNDEEVDCTNPVLEVIAKHKSKGKRTIAESEQERDTKQLDDSDVAEPSVKKFVTTK
jgi:hypothetical protein